MLFPAHAKPGGGTPVYHHNTVNSTTFYCVKYEICEEGTNSFREGTYWTSFPNFIDHDIESMIDAHSKEDVYYTWNWEIVRERIGPPKDFRYSVMHY